MIYIVRINNTAYEVEVEQGQAEIINSQTITAAAPVAAPTAAAPQAAPAAVSTTGGEPVKAPMPGSILDIKVRAGETVKSGQILLVLEAMKMENEILAPRDGKVKDLIVSKGASVATDDILLTLE